MASRATASSRPFSDFASMFGVGLQAGEVRPGKAMSRSTEAPVYAPRL
jgi:hypothetical protein